MFLKNLISILFLTAYFHAINSSKLIASIDIYPVNKIASIRDEYKNQTIKEKSVEQCFKEKIKESYVYGVKNALVAYETYAILWNYECRGFKFTIGKPYYKIWHYSSENRCQETVTKRTFYWEKNDGLVYYDQQIMVDSSRYKGKIKREKVDHPYSFENLYTENYKFRCKKNKNLKI